MLIVKMLGEFSLTYGDTPIILQQGRDNIVQPLLQYFLYHHRSKMPSDVIYNDIYTVQDAADPAHLMRVNIYRLKKVLAESTLPKHEYIRRTKRMYHWTPDVTCITDVDLFREAAEASLSSEIAGEDKIAACRKALDLYTGELLPGKGDKRWIAVESLKLKKLFMKCLDTLTELYTQNGERDELLNYCNQALLIYPSDESLHLLKMECLFDLRRFAEAIHAFNVANSSIYAQLGVPPSKKFLELYSKMSKETMGTKTSIDEIKASLLENDRETGAYYSSYPTFVEAYRFLARTAERSGQSVFLMLIELNIDESEQQDERSQNAMNALQTAIGNSLRRGDLFTRYSATQVLLLLLGISHENCEIVYDRIKRNWKQEWNGRGIHISHREISSVDSHHEPSNIPFKNADRLWSE